MRARSHEQIIVDASKGHTDAELAVALGFGPEHVQRVRDWRRRKRIPPEWWNRVVAAGFSTLDELATAVERSDDANSQPGAAA